jgi:hypothetical protein
LFGAVFITSGEGTCARPGVSAYPHYCSLLTRVDSAEADKVGSREIRFCAYVSVVLDEGMRNRRTTPGALNYFRALLFRRCLLLQAQAATTEPVTTRRLERVASAPAAGPPRHTNPPWTRPSSSDHHSPQPPHPSAIHLPSYCGKSADSVHGFHDVAPSFIAPVTSMAFSNSRSAQYNAS